MEDLSNSPMRSRRRIPGEGSSAAVPSIGAQAAGAQAAGFGSARGDRDDLHRLVDVADFYFRSENFLAALESYNRALSLLPRPAGAERGLIELKVARCHQARGSYQAALQHVDEAKLLLRSSRDPIQLGKIFALRGNILLQMARYDRAQRYCELAYKLLRGTGENATLGELELSLGTILFRLGFGDRAREFFTGALSTFRRIENEGGVASALNCLGLLHKNSCEWREAIRCLNGALELSEKNALAKYSASIRLNLGIVHYKLGDWVLAEEFLNRSRQLAQEIGFTPCLVRNLVALGNLQRRRRRWAESRELFERAAALAEEHEYSRESVLALEFSGELLNDQGHHDEAAELYLRALARAEEIAPLGDLVNEICRRLAETRLEQGHYEEALVLGQRALSSSSRIDDQYERAITCRVVGLAYSRLGRANEAEQFIGESLDSLTRIGESFELGQTLLRVGQHRKDAPDQAIEDLKKAFGIFLSLGTRGYAALAACEVAEVQFRSDRLDEAILHLDRALDLTSEAEEPALRSRITRLRLDVENAYALRWTRAGGTIDAFKEVARLLQGGNDVGTALNELVHLGVTRSQSDRGFAALADATGTQRLMALHGLERSVAERILSRLSRGFKETLQENRPVIVSQVASDDRFAGDAAQALLNVRTFALLPLALPSGRPGVLYIDRLESNPAGTFNQAELNLLTLVCNLAALSVLEHQRQELLQENRTLKTQLLKQPYPEIVTGNARMIEMLRMAEKVGECAASILVEGETGTGKGLIAQAIHDHSPRRGKPFIQVNCAALPEQLLESELFGHTQGAFTGATREKSGLFKEADGGTLFLDEVDKTSEILQGKLLHVLDQKEIRPVGSTRWHKVDTRVIVATNVDLRERIRGGRFLEDLYYRLNDFIIKVPALRDRRDDIPLLLDHFLARFGAQYGKGVVEMRPEVRRALVAAEWRGNVRELEKTVRRMVILAEENEPIGMDLFPGDHPTAPPVPADAGGSLRDEVARTERRVIGDALGRNHWNKLRVARELKISYPCLLKKIRDLGLERPAAL